MQKILIVIVIGVLLSIGIGYYFFQPPTSNTSLVSSDPVRLETEERNETLPPSPAPQFIQSSPDTARLQAGGSSYSDTQGVFAFLYPSDYAIDHQEGDTYTRVIKRGASQRPQSEISDGVMVVFERVELGEKSLSEWVDDQIKLVTSDATAEVTQPKTPVALKEYAGYTYGVKSFGAATYLVVSKDPSSKYAVRVSALVADPQQKNYQAEVDAILLTLELKK